MTVFSKTYDTATPPGGGDPREADDRMREIKAAIQERENVDHYWPLTGTEVSDVDVGEHRKVTLRVGSTPSNVANKGFLYLKDVGSKGELHFVDEGGNEIVMSSLGNNLANNTNLTATNEAGDGSVNLIKAGRNEADDADVAIVPDAIRAATSAAPGEDTGLANKKYVDDNSGSANWTPTSYAGEESIIFPNGLIMKQGADAVGANSSGTVTFGTAFPNAIVNALVSYGSDENANAPHVSDLLLTQMTIRNRSGSAATINWIALGY